MSKLAYYRSALGFDKSKATPFEGLRIGCSRCDALVINGVATHETGCPNQTHECKGCNNRVERRGNYCSDCL